MSSLQDIFLMRGHLSSVFFYIHEPIQVDDVGEQIEQAIFTKEALQKQEYRPLL